MAKRRPSSPEEAHRKMLQARKKAFEAVNLPGDAAGLPKNCAIQVTRAGEKREEQRVDGDSARRLDMIEEVRALVRKQECAGCYDALRRFDRDILVRQGEGDKGRAMERVDEDSPKDRTDKIVDAGKTIDGVEARLSRRDWWLINELVRPTRSYSGWRGVVRFVTGEENEHAQAGAMRAAAVNLRQAYEDLDQAQAGRGKKAA